MPSIVYENDFIVGGSPNHRLSPNFKLKEFARPDGSLFIHRELAAALQVLRDQQEVSPSIEGFDLPQHVEAGPSGQFLLTRADDQTRLARLAGRMINEGYFARVQPAGDALYLQMPDPDNLPPMKPRTAFECGLEVTAAYETSETPFRRWSAISTGPASRSGRSSAI